MEILEEIFTFSFRQKFSFWRNDLERLDSYFFEIDKNVYNLIRRRFFLYPNFTLHSHNKRTIKELDWNN